VYVALWPYSVNVAAEAITLMTGPSYRIHALKAKAEIVCTFIQNAYRMVRPKSGNAYQREMR
jgi:hypothetical protein